ncbi:hypothetical protein CH274_13110 [Rhodococcus sp. 06-418-5]|uniref:hypothetical protein n=1 Tax=Rhodococcus sp. 06-418-5 TaxID=2022507 RepID=UPI000B9ACE7C|nr:hypothetical protein [Rhodococcus sp. 06-418-5]OZC80170.1 hypothetical protein CH274_13110 [Rhodococcus sp. 06-418-5]
MIISADSRETSEKLGLTGLLAVAAMFAAVLQTIAIALQPGVPGLTLMDDAVVVVLVVSIFFRLAHAPGWTAYVVAVWMMFMVFGAVRSLVEPGITFILFRQVTIPALLVLVGLTLTQYEWRRIVRIAIWIGIVNAVYMIVELLGVRILDPVTLATYDRSHLPIRDGVPTYYFYYSEFTGSEPFFRAGGMVLNPPIAGLVTGGALALLWWTKDFRNRKLFMLLLAVSTAFTFGRGGILVAACAIALPAMIRGLGKFWTIVIASPVAYLIGTQLADDGNSSIHAKGLIDGLRFSVESYGFGMGFGVTGNALKALRRTWSSESLLGIAFAAGGIVAVLIVAALLAKLFLTISQGGNWEAAVGIGMIVAALFSESAGALNGTIPLWLAMGVALRKAYDYRSSQTGLLAPGTRP